jgi:hypothetical protein
MKKHYISIIIAGLVLSFSSCKKYEEPYIKIKDEAGNVYKNNAVLTVSSDATKKLFVESGYINEKKEDNRMYYRMQVNGEPEADGGQDISFLAGMLNITSLGSYNNLETEDAVITLNFTNDGIGSGETVRITVQDTKSLQRTIIFKVE